MVAPIIIEVSKAHIDGELKAKRRKTSMVISKTSAGHNQRAALPTRSLMVSIVRNTFLMA
jgi:hypothetical protein